MHTEVQGVIDLKKKLHLIFSAFRRKRCTGQREINGKNRQERTHFCGLGEVQLMTQRRSNEGGLILHKYIENIYKEILLWRFFSRLFPQFGTALLKKSRRQKGVFSFRGLRLSQDYGNTNVIEHMLLFKWKTVEYFNILKKSFFFSTGCSPSLVFGKQTGGSMSVNVNERV